MPKVPQPPKSMKPPGKRPKAPVSRASNVGLAMTKQDAVGDVADKITRAPKKARR